MPIISPLPVAVALLIPLLLAGALWLYVRRRQRVGAALGDRGVVARISGTDLAAVPWTRLALILAAGLALSAAATDPRWGRDVTTPVGRGIDLVLVQDASNSMLVEDLPPNRLERQRDLARTITRERPGDRIGVVVFAGRAYILSPPTMDRGAVQLYLNAVGPDIVEQTGSSLAAALAQGAALLAAPDAAGAARVMVITSDGEVHEERDAVLSAATRAATAGLTIHTVGIGTPAGGLVPELDPVTGARVGVKIDPGTGAPAISRADPTLMREVARIGNGRFFDIADPGATEALLEVLAREQHTRRAGEPRGDGRPQYVWFVALALLLLAVDGYRTTTRRTRSNEES